MALQDVDGTVNSTRNQDPGRPLHDHLHAILSLSRCHERERSSYPRRSRVSRVANSSIIAKYRNVKTPIAGLNERERNEEWHCKLVSYTMPGRWKVRSFLQVNQPSQYGWIAHIATAQAHQLPAPQSHPTCSHRHPRSRPRAQQSGAPPAAGPAPPRPARASVAQT